MTEEPEEQPMQLGPILMRPDQVGGVWANFARVSHSEYEFTLDFVRLDHTIQPPNGVLQVRVNMSPLMVAQLIDALNSNWATYSKKAMPKEVYGNDSSAED